MPEIFQKNGKSEKSFLKRESLPYVFTLVLGILGFQINSLINDLVSAPLIKYNVKLDKEYQSGNYTYNDFSCEFTNISKGSLFSNIRTDFIFDSSLSGAVGFSNASIVVVHPSTTDGDSTLFMRHKASFYLTNFQPGCTYFFRFSTFCTVKNDETPHLYIDSKETVKLKNSGVETYIIEHQVIINLIIIAALILFLLIYPFISK